MNEISKTHSVGLGTMGLCIVEDRPSLAAAKSILQDLVENENLTLIDTADAYCLDETDFGYGDELLAGLVSMQKLLITTKGGFTRPHGAWVPCGDPTYIKLACENTLTRLGTDSLPLHQMHTVDPKVPYTDTVGAFIELKNAGKIQQIGLSNVTLEQLRTAVQMTEIASVQNPMSVLMYNPEEDDEMLRFGEEHSITFLAYAPLGGFRNRGRLAEIEDLQGLASRCGISIYEFALAFLKQLSSAIIPIPGSTSKAHFIQNLAAKDTRIPSDIYAELLAILSE